MPRSRSEFAPGQYGGAWRDFRRNKGGRPAVRAFEPDAAAEVTALAEDLRAGTYRPQPYRLLFLREPKRRLRCTCSGRRSSAYQRDLPAISGSRGEVYAALHAAEVLGELPSEHAGRAALQILAELSPIIRRVHHRRWSLMLPELRDPTTAVVREIRTLEGEAG